MANPRPNAGPPHPPLTDDRLRQLAYDPIVASNANEVAMAIELLELRQRVAGTIDPEATADGFGLKGLSVVDGIPTLTAAPTSEQARELETRLDRYREALEEMAQSSCLSRTHVRCWDRHSDSEDWCYPCVAQYALDPWTGPEAKS